MARKTLNNDVLIAAAEAHAAAYEDDDRQDIKTDVLNAFYAGAKFADKIVPAPVSFETWWQTTGKQMIPDGMTFALADAIRDICEVAWTHCASQAADNLA